MKDNHTYIYTDSRFVRNDTIKTWAFILIAAAFVLIAAVHATSSGWLSWSLREEMGAHKNTIKILTKRHDDALAIRYHKDNWVLPPEKPLKKGEKR